MKHVVRQSEQHLLRLTGLQPWFVSSWSRLIKPAFHEVFYVGDLWSYDYIFEAVDAVSSGSVSSNYYLVHMQFMWTIAVSCLYFFELIFRSVFKNRFSLAKQEIGRFPSMFVMYFYS